MSTYPLCITYTDVRQANELLARSTIDDSWRHTGGRCYIGTAPSHFGLLGVLLANDPVHVRGGAKTQLVALVLHCINSTAEELGIEPMIVVPRSIKRRTKIAMALLGNEINERMQGRPLPPDLQENILEFFADIARSSVHDEAISE